METRTVEQVEQWDSRPFSGGVDELRSLANAEFTGAVRVGGLDGTWLFVLNGRGVGVFGGTLDDFERDGTTFTAPEPALPLLFAMQEHDGETRAKYYTNDTPFEEVDETLSEGGFTGYIELSENVLSGDYYTVYYGGRSMSCAFLGASERVVGNEEAFERANDEVGIYEVNTVSLDIVDLPAPESEPEPEPEPETEPEPDPEPSSNAGAAGTTDGTPSTAPDSVGGGVDNVGETSNAPTDAVPDAATDATDSAPSTPTETVADAQAAAEQTPSTPDEQARGTAESAARPDEATPDAASDAGRAAERETAAAEPATAQDASSADQPPAENAPATTSDADSEAESASSVGATAANATADDADADATEQASDEDVFSEEEEWRETTSIPALDPDQSTDDSARAAQEAETRRNDRATQQTRQAARQQASQKRATEQRAAQQQAQQRQASRKASGQAAAEQQSGGKQAEATQNEATQKLKQALAERKEEIEQLRTRLSESESERERLQKERTRLQNEVERLESQLEQATAAGQSSVESSSRRHLSPEQALDMTNLFIRYGSKGKPTLENAHDSDVTKDAVNANLQLEHHTQFDTDEVTIEGDGFESFLTETAEYQFVKWVIEELLYEIRDTGHTSGLRDLFDALPKIDRVELHGSVSFEGDEETEGGTESFDVILRDRMGNPLAVANLNNSRDPATGDMMGSLVDAANDVKGSNETLSAAFFVTVSFFEPPALETATEATSGGLLSRDKKESFVKLTRKQGYHLCLVETRGSEFHLNVPEL